jgi:small conductance mechanosensitive channel
MNLVERFTTYLSQNAGLLISRLAAALFVMLAAIAAGRLIGRSVQRALSRGRGETVAPVVRSLISTLIIGGGGVMAAEQLGINISTVLAGAGILGLAVGFGAQTLVKDVISGFFLIFDHVIAVGDTVEIGTVRGTVERVGLRVTHVRSFDGRLWYMPNGAIAIVGNSTREWMRAVIEVKIPGGLDHVKALEVLQQVGDELARERPEAVIEPPFAEGPLSLASSKIGLRLTVKVAPADLVATERELRRRAKAALTKAGLAPLASVPPPR